MTTLVFDTETSLIRPGVWWPELACITGCFVGDDTPFFMTPDEFRAALTDDSITIAAHNAAFDMGVLWRHFGGDPDITADIFAAYDAGRVTDTALRETLIDIALGRHPNRQGYSLDAVAQRRLGIEPLDKTTWRLRFGELIGTPIDQWPGGAREYALGDAAVTAAVYADQESDRRYLADQYRQTFSAFCLQLMSWRGMVTDPAMVARLRERYESDYRDAHDRCQTVHGLIRANGTRDMKAVAAAMEAECAATGRAVPLTATGRVAVNKDALEGVETAAMVDYAVVSQYRAILDDHIPSLEAGLVQPDFNPLVATGRTSCRKSKLVNGYQTQNIRREPGIRECFRARDGYVFASADFSTLELHTLAQSCLDIVGYSHLAQALNDGVDVHLWLAASIMGRSYETLDKKDPAVKEARTFAKIGNFGFPGGMGVESFRLWARVAYKTVLTPEQVSDLRDAWFRQWPEMADYFRHINAKCDEGGGEAWLYFPRSERYRGAVSYTAACNSYFQGLGSDAAKAALREVTTECFNDLGTALYGCYPVNFVHDEIILEAPAAYAREAAERLGAVMVEAGSRWTPDVPLRAEPTLMSHWSKDAEGVEKIWTPNLDG